uniref:Aminotransferase class I/II-fold pyridoxal phosphate-dependent enzyme n=1 Tax=Ignisphaera aggregans TaxID=334771 RepID=A0A7C2Z9A4_9CREN
MGSFIAQYSYKEPPADAVRLHLNECLYGVPEFIVDVVSKVLARCNLYPNKVLFDRFRELLAEYVGVDKDEVYPFVGADSALRAVFLMLARPGDSVLHINPTFAMIHILTANLGLRSIAIDTYEDGDWWKVDIDMLIEKSKGVQLAAIVDPNNPTGGPVAKGDRHIVEAIAYNTKGYVVFDETYFEYAGYSVARFLDSIPNLIVVRSMSKAFCLAGFRLGYLAARKDVIARITSINTSFDIPTPSLVAGITALENRRYMDNLVNEVKTLRERLFKDLKSIGFKVFRSYTNFVVIKDPRPLDLMLREKGVYIKKFADSLYRVTVPPPNLYDQFIESMVEIHENSYTKQG